MWTADVRPQSGDHIHASRRNLYDQPTAYARKPRQTLDVPCRSSSPIYVLPALVFIAPARPAFHKSGLAGLKCCFTSVGETNVVINARASWHRGDDSSPLFTTA